jgi:cyclic beta-1,2-glucan synthetase
MASSQQLPVVEPNGPFRDQFLGAQRLDERALALAAHFAIDPRARAENILPRFEANAGILREAYGTLAGDVRAGRFVTAASEWLLDNFHLVASQVEDVRRNLPRAYYRRLPALASREHVGQARVYAVAVELVRHSDGRFTREELATFIGSFQRVAPLTLGELWAWPSMLTLALVENLRRLATEILASRAARTAADACLPDADSDHAMAWPTNTHVAFVVQLLLRTREYGRKAPLLRAAIEAHLDTHQMTAEDAIRQEHRRQAVTQVSVSNVISSLRLCAEIDWREYVESTSLVEHVLRRDPAGVYARMDFLSRDQQRHAVEEIAAPSGEAQVRLALKAVERARQSAAQGSVADRESHVGYHLIGHGRAALEVEAGFPLRLGSRVRRLVLAHPTTVYLGGIATIATCLLAATAFWLQGVGGATATTAMALALLLIPALDVSIAFVQRVVTWAIPPRRLPRLDFSDGLPDTARTMVIIPTMLTGTPSVTALLEHLEVLVCVLSRVVMSLALPACLS